MDFDAFLEQAWTDHAGDAAAVAARLQTSGLDLLQREDQLLQLAQLAQHVHGPHLGRWHEGIAFQDTLAAHPLLAAGSATAASVQRFRSVLRLASELADDRQGQPAGEQVRLGALAAGALAAHDAPRATALLQAALAQADAAALPDDDPGVRALAVAGNLIAGTLEDLAARSEAQRSLMILGAQVSRRCWARAGTWLETERAEYRLAKTWLKAGDAAQAQVHARQCLDIVQAHGSVALERFFGLEVLGLGQHASGDAAAAAATLADMRAAYADLDDGDRGWCQPALAAMPGATAPT